MKTTEKTKTQTEEILDTSSIEFDQMVQKLKKTIWCYISNRNSRSKIYI